MTSSALNVFSDDRTLGSLSHSEPASDLTSHISLTMGNRCVLKGAWGSRCEDEVLWVLCHLMLAFGGSTVPAVHAYK